jgi:Holliday junction resolvase
MTIRRIDLLLLKYYLIICSFLTAGLFGDVVGIQEGDIIFQEIKNSEGKTFKIAANSSLNHLGLVIKFKGRFYIYESYTKVRKVSFREFVQKGVQRKYVVKRLKDSKEIYTDEAKKKLREEVELFSGKPYDLYLGWGDEKIYSSELIWKVLKNSIGIELVPLKQIKDFNQNHPYVKMILRQRFGNSLPLEEYMVAPNDIYRSTLLETIYSNFTEEDGMEPEKIEMIEKEIEKVKEEIPPEENS